jgi:hypothetical protein
VVEGLIFSYPYCLRHLAKGLGTCRKCGGDLVRAILTWNDPDTAHYYAGDYVTACEKCGNEVQRGTFPRPSHRRADVVPCDYSKFAVGQEVYVYPGSKAYGFWKVLAAHMSLFTATRKLSKWQELGVLKKHQGKIVLPSLTALEMFNKRAQVETISRRRVAASASG